MILKDDRPLESAYEFSKERIQGIDFEKFVDLFSDWAINGIYNGPHIAGVIFIRNGFVHISINPEYRKKWASKKLIKQILDKASLNGKVYTTIHRGDEFRANFASRLGFEKIREVEDIELYEANHEI